jgi:hypothetical protein
MHPSAAFPTRLVPGGRPAPPKAEIRMGIPPRAFACIFRARGCLGAAMCGVRLAQSVEIIEIQLKSANIRINRRKSVKISPNHQIRPKATETQQNVQTTKTGKPKNWEKLIKPKTRKMKNAKIRKLEKP